MTWHSQLCFNCWNYTIPFWFVCVYITMLITKRAHAGARAQPQQQGYKAGKAVTPARGVAATRRRRAQAQQQQRKATSTTAASTKQRVSKGAARAVASTSQRRRGSTLVAHVVRRAQRWSMSTPGVGDVDSWPLNEYRHWSSQR